MISRVLLLTGYLWNTPVRYIWVIFGGLLSSPGGMLNKSTRNERQVMSVENTNTGKAEITNKHLNGLIKKKTIDGTIINSIVMSHYNSTDTLQQEIEHLQHGPIFYYNRN
jgi:hypothetical protein